ncbi:MAG: hypothetical protein Fur009_2260 [Candidatus Microgenomates bacterium]
MAKKTRKQKIIAQYRRKILLINQEKNLEIKSKKLIKSNTEIKKMEENDNPNQDLSLNTSYFISDLKKSLLISFLIIALEIGLYFVKLIK